MKTVLEQIAFAVLRVLACSVKVFILQVVDPYFSHSGFEGTHLSMSMSMFMVSMCGD
jgi:uncharacterized membrane protein